MKSAVKQKSQTLEGLNKQQLSAVTFGPPTGGGPLLIIAGAGTGKTTVLTRRIAWLLEQGLAKPEEILALTFTEKAATEMEERVDQLMPLGFVEISISTFHAFAQKVLQQHALDIGLPGDFKVITETEAWMLLKQHLHEFDLDYYLPFGNPNKFLHTLIKHFQKAKGEEISPEEYLKYAENLRLNADYAEIKKKAKKIRNSKSEIRNPKISIDEQESVRIAEVANAYHKYQKLLLDNSYFDFGDLINYTLKLFRTRPKILEHYQNQYKYILVDEFQDTDLSQYEMVKALAKPQNNLTVVGDDDQSIYKFRGASISNILKFKDDYKEAAEVTLTDNYRSTQNILDMAYKFIRQNDPERLESRLKIDKKLVSHKNLAGSIEVLRGQTVYDEARLTVEKIMELAKQGLTWNDFAILVRANDHAEPFLSELSRCGIPFIFVANRGLYKKPLILDLLSYFRLLDNYHESENLLRIFNTEKFKLADSDLILISQTAKKKTLSIYEVIKNVRNLVDVQPESIKKIDLLLELIAKHTRLSREKPVTEVFVTIYEDLGLKQQLLKDNVENVENRSLIQQFFRKAQGFEQDSDMKTLSFFLTRIKLELEAGDQGDLSFNPDLGPEAVRVMTVHASKGLEFRCVFVVNLVDQRFPSRERRDQIEIPTPLVKEVLPEGDVHLMEERRLFYVAATRAKEYLFLTWAEDYGGSSSKKPSRFLIELGMISAPEKSKPAGQVFFVPAAPNQQAHIKDTVKYSVPETFSFSQISCFINCPLEYKLRYIYQLPMAGTANLSLGDTIHKTLEKFMRNFDQLNRSHQADLFGATRKGLEIPPKDLLYKYYAECWVDDWYPDKIQKERARKLGKKMLDNFYERFSDNPKPIKFLEHKFKLKLGDYKFVGKIDRADLNPDGSLDIVDYKTGQIKEKLTPDDKNQLLIYQWAAAEEFKEKVNSLSYWYLASLRESQQFLGSAEDLTNMKKKLLDTIAEIIEAIKADSFAQLDKKLAHDCKYREFMV